MRPLLPTVAGICLMAAPAFCQIDYANPVVETVVTRQQILDFTGSSGIALRCMVINNRGQLVITDRGGALGDARLIEIDISGPVPVFRTLANESQMAAVLQTSSIVNDDTGAPVQPRLNFSALGHRSVAGVNYYYVHQFGQNPNNCATCADEIIEIADTDPVSIRRVGSLDGPGAVGVIGDQLYLPITGAFSNQLSADGVWRMDIATGASQEIADVAAFQALSATNPGLQGAGFTTGEDGLAYVFSEEFRTGSDSLIVLDPSNNNALSVLEPKASFAPNFPGFAAMAVDTNGTLFAFDQFPAILPRRFVIRESDGTLHFPDPAAIIAALGLTNQNQQFFPNDSMRVVVEGPDKVVLYATLADGAIAVGNPRIISMTFSARDPLLIELESFTATAAHAGAPVHIDWVTASEIDTVGFRVRRAFFDGTNVVPGAPVTNTLIPAQGTNGMGASYSLIDPLPVGPELRRGYFLIEVDANGLHSPYGPFWTTVGGAPSNVPAWPLY